MAVHINGHCFYCSLSLNSAFVRFSRGQYLRFNIWIVVFDKSVTFKWMVAPFGHNIPFELELILLLKMLDYGTLEKLFWRNDTTEFSVICSWVCWGECFQIYRKPRQWWISMKWLPKTIRGEKNMQNMSEVWAFNSCQDFNAMTCLSKTVSSPLFINYRIYNKQDAFDFGWYAPFWKVQTKLNCEEGPLQGYRTLIATPDKIKSNARKCQSIYHGIWPV